MLLQRNALHIESRTRLVVWVRMMPKIGKISGWTVTAEIGWEPSNRVSELRKRSVWTACQIISNMRCGASRWLMLIVRSLHLGTAYFQLHPFDVAGRSPKSPTILILLYTSNSASTIINKICPNVYVMCCLRRPWNKQQIFIGTGARRLTNHSIFWKFCKASVSQFLILMLVMVCWCLCSCWSQ